MNLNDRIHGFVVKEIKVLPELKGTMVRMTYEKNGADLIWLDRNDDNKTFAIAFKTIPQDHTGVFHILEHSVLNGSKKYPVKEPFVELIKSSMSTFLNAMTFQDKTMYPISSRNDQDYLNLMDVYLDAVLHPLTLEDPHAFQQEGWHYEMDDPDGELRINGVVYNEMKGAYANPDRVLNGTMSLLLYPDTCYGYESGGHPDHVPELTYENYLASHKRFYHPSNARIFLDGKVNLDDALAKIDGYLCEYDYLEMDTSIPMQAPVKPEEATCYYEIGAEEDASNKAILEWASVYGTFADREKNMAVEMLSQVLCGSNEAPLTHAILEAGLAEDVEFGADDGIQQPSVNAVFRNVKPENKDAVWALMDKTLRDLAANGIDHEQLHSILDSMEYRNREKEFGVPAGLLYGIQSMTTWLYDGKPEDGMCQEDVFAAVRAGIDNGYFEKFLLELLDSPHQAKLCMLPSKTVNAEKQAKLREELAKLKEEKGRAWCEETVAFFKNFRARQNREDTPEELATLPVLDLKDIPEAITEIPQSVCERNGVTVLHQDQETDGIVHMELYFSLNDLPMEKMHEVELLSNLLGEVATEKYSVLQVQSQLHSKIGRFTTSTAVFDHDGEAKPYLVVRISLLESKKAEVTALVEEVLNHSRFDDAEFLFHMVQQLRMGAEQHIIGAGNAFAVMRLGSGVSAAGALSETMEGISQLRWLQDTEKNYEEKKGALCSALADLAKNVFNQNRLTVSYTGKMDETWLDTVIGCFAKNPVGEKAAYEKLPVRKEGFLIPAQIGFAGKCAMGDYIGGAGIVAARMLSYGHLWNEVRVKGGAYGTRLNVSAKGTAAFSSYRDPNPNNSLNVFDASGNALRAFCDSEESVDRYIVSTLNTIDPLLTPRTKGTTAAKNYFEGNTNEKQQQLRSEVLHTTKADLAVAADKLDAICAKSGICVIGGKNVLDACGERIETIEALQ